jgi:hypothetical protein
MQGPAAYVRDAVDANHDLLLTLIPPCCCVGRFPLAADLGEKAGQYSSDVAVLGLVVGGLLGGGYLLTQRAQQQESSSSSGLPQVPEVPPLEVPREEVLQGQQK